MTYAERVARGMEFLDAASPGWESKINIFTLDIARGDRCAMGQVFGSYSRGLSVTGCVASEAHGFSGMGQNYPALTMEWKRQIVARQVAKQDMVLVA